MTRQVLLRGPVVGIPIVHRIVRAHRVRRWQQSEDLRSGRIDGADVISAEGRGGFAARHIYLLRRAGLAVGVGSSESVCKIPTSLVHGGDSLADDFGGRKDSSVIVDEKESLVVTVI